MDPSQQEEARTRMQQKWLEGKEGAEQTQRLKKLKAKAEKDRSRYDKAQIRALEQLEAKKANPVKTQQDAAEAELLECKRKLNATAIEVEVYPELEAWGKAFRSRMEALSNEKPSQLETFEEELVREKK